jgi:hypothetical protein
LLVHAHVYKCAYVCSIYTYTNVCGMYVAYIGIQMCICIPMCICIHMRIRLIMHVYTYICTFVYVYILHTHAHLYTYIYTLPHAHTTHPPDHACVCVHACRSDTLTQRMHTYTHTHTDRHTHEHISISCCMCMHTGRPLTLTHCIYIHTYTYTQTDTRMSRKRTESHYAKRRFSVGSAFFKKFVGGHADPTTGIVSNDCVVSSTNRMISLFLLHISPRGKIVSLGATRSLCGTHTHINYMNANTRTSMYVYTGTYTST